MSTFDTMDIKNIVLLGHTGEGKTTIAEAMLYNSKATDRLGKVSEGNTVMDYDEQEIARKISVSMGIANFFWKGVKINLIDAPGYFDFEGEQIQAISAADAAVVVMSAHGGLAVGSEKAIDYCIKNAVPLMIFINQMDKENANYLKTINVLKEKYKTKIAPLEIPVMDGVKMRGFVDVLEGKAYLFSDDGPQPTVMGDVVKSQYDNIRLQLTEAAAETDDALLEKYFNEGTLSDEEVVLGIRKGIAGGSAIPVLSGSGLFNKGIINLLQAIVKCMPSYSDKGNTRGVAADGSEVFINCRDEKRFSAIIFKTIADPFVGKMNLFKVISGEIKPGMTVLNTTKGKQERINGVLVIKGKKQDTVDVLSCGDIGAFTKLSYTGTGDTLCDPSLAVTFAKPDLPRPVLSMAAYAAKGGEEDKVFGGLNRLSEEDVTFTVSKNVETGEMLLSGLGEAHLDVIAKKLKSKFGAEAVLKTPKVAYRETIKSIALAEGKHKKQSGGHGQYGHCKMRFEPYPDAEFAFEDEVVGGTVPKAYIPAVEKGIRESINKGVLAGYRVVNIKAVLYDGSYHDVDSSEESFKIAASLSFKDGMAKANPVLLEPVYKLSVIVPENYIGDIMGDMNKRRGRILGMEGTDEGQCINAEVPQSEIFKYASDLRSLTQGRGKFELEFVRYEEVPREIADKAIAAAKQA